MPADMGVKVRFHKGAWWLFIDHQGHRKSKKIGDRETAHDVARAVRDKLARGDLGLFNDKSTETFAAYAQRWLDTPASARKASTQRFYAFNVKLHLVPVLGTTRIGDITRARCRDVLASCRDRGLKLASLKGVQRTLSAILSQAVEDELLPANPAFRMGKHLRPGDEPRAEIQPLTALEVFDFVAAAQLHTPDHATFFLMALRTGLRLGELLGVQWGDLNLAGRYVEVRHNLVGGRVTSTKNTNRRRVDLSLKLTEALQEHRTAMKAASLKAGRRLPAWVFTNRDGEPLDGDNVRHRVFYPLLETAKLRRIRFHDLRHTFASLLIQNGEPLTYVRDQMGHSSIAVTVDIYGHLVPSANRAAVDKLDAIPVRVPDASESAAIKSSGEAK
jgi:integrase